MPSSDSLDYIVTAQYSPTLELWIGHLWDGEHMHVFDPRSTREKALNDARMHKERILHPQEATKVWTRGDGA